MQRHEYVAGQGNIGMFSTGRMNMLYALRDERFGKLQFDLHIPGLTEACSSELDYPYLKLSPDSCITDAAIAHAAHEYTKRKYGMLMTGQIRIRTEQSIAGKSSAHLILQKEW